MRVHGLDTLRSLAILSVIAFHVWGYGGEGKLPEWFVPVAKQGWMGVDLFFVLSGYLIGSQLLKPYLAGERPGLWSFYRKRFYRVLPAYFVVLALYLLVPGWRESPGLAPVWAFLTFTLNLVIGRYHAFAFSHAWSLCVEEHFYLVLPVIVLLLMRKPSLRKGIGLVIALLLTAMGTRAFVLYHVLQPRGGGYLTLIYYPTYTHFDGLVVGVCLAAIRIFRPAWWKALAQHGHLLMCAAVALVGAAVYLCKDRYESTTGVAAVGDVIGFSVLSIGLGLLVASSMSENGLLSRVRVPGAQLIATLAYSLYLTQKEMIHLVSRWFPILDASGPYPWMAVYAVACLLVAGTLYLSIERPFLILRDRIKPAAKLPEISSPA